jgi:histidinol-phosphate aminotransferase
MIQPNEHLLNISRLAERMDERAGAVRLDRNERVTPFPPHVFRDMLATLSPESFSVYPDPSPLYKRLGRDLGVPEDHLYLTNGSDAAIRMVFQTYVRPGDTVAFPDPTYAMYAIYTRIFHGKGETVPYDAEKCLDTRRLFQLLDQRPRVLAIANPDQPTGAVLPESSLRQLAVASREAETLFIIDEAYYPFYPHTAVHLVREFDHVIVTRTFSKVAGLAGLRLGYLAAHPDIVTNIQRIRGAHEVNAVAIAVGSYVLDHPELAAAHLTEISAGREVMAAAARRLGLGVPDCPTNFQLLQFPGRLDTTDVVVALKRKGYLVKGGFSAPAMRNCIRVTLGPPDVMAGFVEALEQALSDIDKAMLR